MYGTRAAALAWQKEVTTTMEGLGFKVSRASPSKSAENTRKRVKFEDKVAVSHHTHALFTG